MRYVSKQYAKRKRQQFYFMLTLPSANILIPISVIEIRKLGGIFYEATLSYFFHMHLATPTTKFVASLLHTKNYRKIWLYINMNNNISKASAYMKTATIEHAHDEPALEKKSCDILLVIL